MDLERDEWSNGGVGRVGVRGRGEGKGVRNEFFFLITRKLTDFGGEWRLREADQKRELLENLYDIFRQISVVIVFFFLSTFSPPSHPLKPHRKD